MIHLLLLLLNSMLLLLYLLCLLLLYLLVFDGGWSRAAVTHGVAVLSDGVASRGLDVGGGDGRSDDSIVVPHGGRT